MTKTFGNFTDLIDFSRSSGGTALRKVSYGSELVTNGTFDTDTNWTKGTSWSISGGAASCDGSHASGNAYIDQDLASVVTAGKVYQINFDVTARTGTGNIPCFFGANNGFVNSNLTVGSYTFNAVAGLGLDDKLYFGCFTGNTITIDNVSVKEVTLDSGSDDPVLFNHPDDIPRIEYDADGTVKGLLIEEARTNLFTYDNPSSSAWYKNESTVTANAATAPDGTTTASKLVENTATGVHYTSETITATGDTNYTMSVFAKAGERGYLKLQCGFVSNWVVAHDIIFDLSDGSLHSSTHAGSIEGTHFGSYDIGNGWYRLWISGTTISSATQAGFNLHLATGVGNEVSYTGDGTSGIYVWGAQLEAASTPSSYIPTSGSTATRSSESLTIPAANLPYSSTAMTIQMDGRVTYADEDTSNTVRFFNWYETASNYLRMRLRTDNGSGQVQSMVFAPSNYDTVIGASGSTYAPDVLVPYSVSARFTSSALNHAVDGVSETVNTTPTDLPTLSSTDLSLGKGTASGPYNGTIRNFRMWGNDIKDDGIEIVTQPSIVPSLSLSFDGSEASHVEFDWSEK